MVSRSSIQTDDYRICSGVINIDMPFRGRRRNDSYISICASVIRSVLRRPRICIGLETGQIASAI